MYVCCSFICMYLFWIYIFLFIVFLKIKKIKFILNIFLFVCYILDKHKRKTFAFPFQTFKQNGKLKVTTTFFKKVTESFFFVFFLKKYHCSFKNFLLFVGFEIVYLKNLQFDCFVFCFCYVSVSFCFCFF